MYEEAIAAIDQCGQTMMPGLLAHVVERATLLGVFLPGGAAAMANRVERRVRAEMTDGPTDTIDDDEED